MSNIATKKTTKDDFQESYKDYPDTQPKGFEPFHESRVLPIFYEIPDGAKVLDVGCNSGEFMRLLKEKKGCEVTGIDVSDTVLEIARKKDLYVVKGDAEDICFPDNSFDVVVLMEVLVHLYNPKKALKEIKRVLKPGGILLGSAPHENLERYVWDDNRLHHRYYNEITLSNELYSVFEIVFMRVLKGAQFAVSMANSHLSQKPAEILFKCGGFKSKDWGEPLLDKTTLRTYFGFTQLPGTVYYRMKGFADKMGKLPKTEIGYEPFNEEAHIMPGEWQSKISIVNGEVKKGNAVLHALDAIVKSADLSVWQIVGNRSAMSVLATIKFGLNKTVVSEVDDWLFDIPSYNAASGPYRPNSDAEYIAIKQLEWSDAIITSTRFIKEGLKKIYPKKKIYVVPNSIDFEIWDNLEAIPFQKKKGLRIGYTGCGNHSWDIEIPKRAILELLDEYEDLEFILPQPFDSWKEVNHPRVLRSDKWVSIDTFPAMVKGWDLDIGIAPLRDNNLNRAKSNLRWLEYSALKVPTVASNVYPFKNSIRNGIDGLICSTRNEWYTSLKGLIDSSVRRKEIGHSAYNRVKQDFNMDKTALLYREVLEEIKRESGRTQSRTRKIARRSKP